MGTSARSPHSMVRGILSSMTISTVAPEIAGEVSDKVFPEYEIGDKVRILRKKHTFEDKLMTKYHDVIFKVTKVYTTLNLIKFF